MVEKDSVEDMLPFKLPEEWANRKVVLEDDLVGKTLIVVGCTEFVGKDLLFLVESFNMVTDKIDKFCVKPCSEFSRIKGIFYEMSSVLGFFKLPWDRLWAVPAYTIRFFKHQGQDLSFDVNAITDIKLINNILSVLYSNHDTYRDVNGNVYRFVKALCTFVDAYADNEILRKNKIKVDVVFKNVMSSFLKVYWRYRCLDTSAMLKDDFNAISHLYKFISDIELFVKSVLSFFSIYDHACVLTNLSNRAKYIKPSASPVNKKSDVLLNEHIFGHILLDGFDNYGFSHPLKQLSPKGVFMMIRSILNEHRDNIQLTNGNDTVHFLVLKVESCYDIYRKDQTKRNDDFGIVISSTGDLSNFDDVFAVVELVGTVDKGVNKDTNVILTLKISLASLFNYARFVFSKSIYFLEDNYDVSFVSGFDDGSFFKDNLFGMIRSNNDKKLW